ncbi:hypothetical protein [Arcticibacter tournemirensis]|uniref:Uncharacterized protein n=1 Tax=Arcticibacter tournemirensis TaxID=699437 RepID=A0A4Q0M8K3_9SPHI|nr:hypothetical protein [Arcticibacter tournemirensis]RXF69119.1 hypothetical protein EKH83_13270 [Arcticibacter tournemirensis]
MNSSSFIKNPEMYSLFDYASQWYMNCNHVMSTYKFETLNGQLSFPLLFEVLKKAHLISYSSNEIEALLYNLWGENFDKFNGLVANLLFDFGYLGTFIVTALYVYLVWILRPVRNRLSFSKLLVLGGLFLLPAMGIFNSQMKTIAYNALIIYSAIVYMYMVIRVDKRKVSSP